MRASQRWNPLPSLPTRLTPAASPAALKKAARTPNRRGPIRRLISSLALLVPLASQIHGAYPLSASALRSAHGSHLLRLSQDQHTDKEIPTLELGKPVERELFGGQSHSYRIVLAAKQYLHVVVDQRGIDVVVALYGPTARS